MQYLGFFYLYVILLNIIMHLALSLPTEEFPTSTTKLQQTDYAIKAGDV